MIIAFWIFAGLASVFFWGSVNEEEPRYLLIAALFAGLAMFFGYYSFN